MGTFRFVYSVDIRNISYHRQDKRVFSPAPQRATHNRNTNPTTRRSPCSLFNRAEAPHADATLSPKNSGLRERSFKNTRISLTANESAERAIKNEPCTNYISSRIGKHIHPRTAKKAIGCLKTKRFSAKSNGYLKAERLSQKPIDFANNRTLSKRNGQATAGTSNTSYHHRYDTDKTSTKHTRLAFRYQLRLFHRCAKAAVYLCTRHIACKTRYHRAISVSRSAR